MSATKKESVKKFALLERTSSFVIGRMEDFFYRWGIYTARHPYIVILVSLLLTLLTISGFIRFRLEGNAEKLWIPADSPYLERKSWLNDNYPQDRRFHFTTFRSESNILTPEALKLMLRFHRQMMEIQSSNKTFDDLCFRIPIANIFVSKKRRRRRSAFSHRRIARQTAVNATSGRRQILVPVVAGNSNFPAAAPSGGVVGVTEVEGNTLVEEEPDQDYDFEDIDDKAVTLTSFDASTGVPSSTEPTSTSTSTSTSTEAEDYEYVDYSEYYDDEEDHEEPLDWVTFDEVEAHKKKVEESTKSGNGGKVVDENDPQDILSPGVYCDLVDTLDDKCLFSGLPEIWRFSEPRINTLSQEDIVEAINIVAESPWFGTPAGFKAMLGGKKYDSEGRIISATSAIMAFQTKVDLENAVKGGPAGVELDLADETNLEWERKLIEMQLELAKESEETLGIKIFVHVARSFQDITVEAIFFDAVKMAIGYFLMFGYTMFFLGRTNLVEHRGVIAMLGILSVGFGLLIGYGLSAALGLPYTPIHAILPFLALGIGIDDMFVIVQCFYNLDPEEQKKDIVEKMGLTMRHAGVAITVTSLTDVFAFGIGAVTILPGLQAFCVTCAISVFSIYLLQASWFAAWMSLDNRRIEQRRDGFFWCIKYKNWRPWACSRRENGKENMKLFSKVLRNRFVKFTVLTMTIGFGVAGIYGSYLMRQEFDPILLLPPDSYLRQWLDNQDADYPKDGWWAQIYTGTLDDYANDFEEYDKMNLALEEMVEDGKIVKKMDSWWIKFKSWINTKKNVTDFREITDDREKFDLYLNQFLYSKHGARDKEKFRFGNSEQTCKGGFDRITATQLSILFVKFDGPDEHIPGRAAVENLVAQFKFSSRAFVFSKVFAAWETDLIIGQELWRNLGLAMACVFIITLVLLADFKICLMVLSCVCLTLVDMVGMLHFWGITIDTISCINIVLAIGLCVDYSAHIAHAYIVEEGSCEDRAMTSLVLMGPAILNGGITTFLALILLGFSNSHPFLTFFKVFFLTVIFGLFHGLVYLPVLLSLFGPSHTVVSKSRRGDDASQNTDSDVVSDDSYFDEEGRTAVHAAKRGYGSGVPHAIGGGFDNGGYVEDELRGSRVRRKLSKLLTGQHTGSWDLEQDPGRVAAGKGSRSVGLSPASSFSSSRASSATSSVSGEVERNASTKNASNDEAKTENDLNRGGERPTQDL